MSEVSDITRSAQQLFRLIAQDQLNAKMRHDLRDLAVKHNCAFEEIHADIKELTDAHAIRMERLGCSNGAAIVRFHLSGDPSGILTELKEHTKVSG